MPVLTASWKRAIAGVMRLRIFRRLMLWGIYLTTPRQRIGVAVVAIDEAERVLMLKHVFHPVAPWGLPGGWLHRNEAPAAGALRELMEETGLTAVLGPVIEVTHETYPAHVGISYLATIQPGVIRLSHEIMEARWFPANSLPSPLLPSTRRTIGAGLRAHRNRQGTLAVDADAPFTPARPHESRRI